MLSFRRFAHLTLLRPHTLLNGSAHGPDSGATQVHLEAVSTSPHWPHWNTSDRFVRNVLPEPRGSVRVIRVALSIPSPWHMLGDGHST